MGFITRDVETQLAAVQTQLTALATQLARFERHFTAATIQTETRIMAKVDDVAAAVAANTDKINAMATAITGMADGHATISGEIAALKDAVANNQPPDFTAVDAALAAQTAAVTAAAALVPST